MRRSVGFWTAVLVVAVVGLPFLFAAPVWFVSLVVVVWLAVDARHCQLERRRRRRAARRSGWRQQCSQK